ncbi:aminodeoxychorismate synthase component I [Streptomyces sp. NPDC089799]|uniref:aminodeoxychorismate synthase component I n=1 Tax=Streptomyces sp. NPDC089799 TaxID=3155066 RepID=UPI0034199527
MRTVLVDNYDSFTYNLFHQITEVTGTEPVVLRNDAVTWRPGLFDGFDAVVLSPGPGTPERAADFGICRDVLERSELPLLGICLGHQGLAHAHGGRVVRAPEPRHGRTSPVIHDGSGLFAGLPSPFEVVRYHSLAVTDLPAELEATAWSTDGVVMGMRHRTLPRWGLQFHPESISTTHGRELIANFRRLVLEHHGRTHAGQDAPQVPDLSARGAELPARGADLSARIPELSARGADPSAAAGPLTAAAPAGGSSPAAPAPVRRLRVLADILTTRWDDESVYDRLFRSGPHGFWLDSSRSGGPEGRFSYLGNAAGPLARIAMADVTSGTVSVSSAGGVPERLVAEDFLDWIDRDLRSCRTDVPALPFDFALGWVGYLGYELKAQCGGEARHRAEDPDAVMVFADRAAVLDHHTGTTYLLALAEDGEEGPARAWLDRTARTLRDTAPVPLPAPAPQAPLTGLRLRHDRDAYLGLIEECQDEIAAGETYEVCLTNLAEADGDPDPWETYRALRRSHPAPFAALLQFGRTQVLSTSPERFLRVGADGIAESRPIKGTRPRGATPAEDAAIRSELASCEKDRAENLMIVDLVRNDLGRCAEPGSVEAEDIFRVETYATVHQLVSTVTARLRAGLSAVDCVRAAFPGGSMTGAPKIRTMQLIDRLEAGPRGIYAGAIGYLSLSGAADLSIVIRTLVLTPGRARYGIGGAIVALSDPAAEFEETAVKSAPLLGLTTGGFPGRTGAETPMVSVTAAR